MRALGPRVVADVQCLQGHDPERGIPRWAAGYLRALRTSGADVVPVTNPDLQPVHPQFADIAATAQPASRADLRKVVDDVPVVYEVLSALEPVRPVRGLLPPAVIDARLPLAVVMYDAALYRFPAWYQVRPGDPQTYAARRALFRTADAFLCISVFTAREVVEVFDVPAERVHVVGTGIDPFFLEGAAADDGYRAALPAVDRPFVLCVGRAEPRKRTVEVIRAFAGLPDHLRRDRQVVIACRVSDETARRWHAEAADAGLEPDQLVVTGLIPDAVLRSLYRSCELFVEPSAYEGFGLPAAEAAASGAVVLTTDAASLPEVLDWPPACVPVDQPGALTAAIERALTSPAFRDDARAAGAAAARRHRWEHVVDRAAEAHERLAARRSVPHRWATVDVATGTFLDDGPDGRSVYPAGALGRTFPRHSFDDGPPPAETSSAPTERRAHP